MDTTVEDYYSQDGADKRLNPPMENILEVCDSREDRLQKRIRQAAQELVETEQSYVRSLKFVAEKYIPLKKQPLLGLVVPKDLEDTWPILWGNWLILLEWHTVFLKRLQDFFDADKLHSLPKAFIDAESRFRDYYSKYCENYRRACYIADMYREFFSEVRRAVEDRQELQSHLIWPVQRIMRYKLPMESIASAAVELRLDPTVVNSWQTALRIMSEIPTHAQLILEASRIDGFKGKVVSLGKVRIRGSLRVAVETSSKQLKSLGPACSQSVSRSSSSRTSLPELLSYEERFLFLFDQRLIITEEIKPKTRATVVQPESTFQYRDSIPVNNLHVEETWRPGGRVYSGRYKDSPDASSSLLQTKPLSHLEFVLRDLTQGRDQTYIINPRTAAERDSWLTHLRDICEEKRNLLIALQDPQRNSPFIREENHTNVPHRPQHHSQVHVSPPPAASGRRSWLGKVRNETSALMKRVMSEESQSNKS